MNNFWDKFYQRPLDDIPWQNTQADWFKQLVDEKKIKGESALDVGCGTGIKSVYLAKNSFTEVIGVDISKKAIEYANGNVDKEMLAGKCKFINANVVNWGFIDLDKKFDFILDWAMIHCLDPIEYKKYAKGVSKHLKKGGLFLVRAFSSDKDEKYFSAKADGADSKVYIFHKQDLLDIFSELELIDENISKPKTKDHFYFIELLFKK